MSTSEHAVVDPITKKSFHVLSLSGGGIRGLHTARILEMLEAHVGVPLAQRFDLLCGTSIGGILALGLALECPASNLRELLEKRGRTVSSILLGLNETMKCLVCVPAAIVE